MEEINGDSVQLTLHCDPQAPATVRQAMCSLEGLGPILGDALLVASELVTNAVRHSGCTEDDLLHVHVSRHDGSLLIEVRDPGSSSSEARIQPAVELPFGGIGLRVVQQLTDRWGAERGRGYTVWARLPLCAYACV